MRTGVTAIIPRGHGSLDDPVYAGTFSLNGNGEMTGTAWVEESGFLEGPIVITNTHSVGVARDAVIAWRIKHGDPDKTGYWWSLPVVAETWDGWLNDINGFHVKPEDVAHALDSATSRPGRRGKRGRRDRDDLLRIQRRHRDRVARARRRNPAATRSVCWCRQTAGGAPQLTIAGVPVGQEIPGSVYPHEAGSIIIAIATDAPLLPGPIEAARTPRQPRPRTNRRDFR